IPNITAAAIRLVSKGNTKCKPNFKRTMTNSITPLKITINSVRFKVWIKLNSIDLYIFIRFNETATITAKLVANIEPFAPIICINTELQINLIKKPAAKLTNANRCSLTPCKIAAVTVYKANNNATGAYQASKLPVILKFSIPNNAPYASGAKAERPTIEGMTSKSTI